MEKMKDIYDIQPILLDNFIDYKITILYVILSLIILAIVYYFISSKKEIQKEEMSVSIKPNFKDRLKSIDLNLDKDRFYAEILAVIKDYLEYKTGKNISKMTLEELKKQNFSKKLYSFIADLYYKEYSNVDIKDTLGQRKELINKLISFIK